MAKAKKYRYYICKSAEGITSGTIDLTKKEASIVAYALNTSNWNNLEEDDWSGSCYIDIDNPMEIDSLGTDTDCGEICKGTAGINIKEIAQKIVDVLEPRGVDNIKDSSGYYIIKEFEDGTDRAVDVYKSTGDGTKPPHYAIYISYEDDNSDWDCTNSLSVEELEKKLEELSK